MGGNAALPNAAAYKAPLRVALSAILWLGMVSLLGRLRDALYFLLHPSAGVKLGYAPIRDTQQDFFIRRLYGAVQVGHRLWSVHVWSVAGARWHRVLEAPTWTHVAM